MNVNTWAIVFAIVAIILAAFGIWEDDVTYGAAAIVFAIFAHAES